MMIEKPEHCARQSLPTITQYQPQSDKRAYWALKMDEADAFMNRIMNYPVHECNESMLSLVSSAHSAGVEIAFSDKPHIDGLPRLFYLRQSLVPSFIAVAREMNDRGWILKVEDGYRTPAMQRGLGLHEHIFLKVLNKVRWECGQDIPPSKLLFRRLAALVANAPKVGTHMSGSAMDISVLSRDTGEEVDRGGPYIELSELTPMDSPFVSATAQENRHQITTLMRRFGFSTYPWEFWHYNAGDAYAEELCHSGKPARYGAVHLDVSTGQVWPVEEPTRLLNSEEDVRLLMEKILSMRQVCRPGTDPP